MAHDIASPTGVALTVLSELEASAGSRPELVAMATRSLRRLMRISEMLDLAAEIELEAVEPLPLPPDNGARESRPSVADFADAARHAADDALFFDRRKDVVLTNTSDTKPTLVEGDARALVFVLREILSNALKSATSRVVLSAAVDGINLVVRIDDDGPGFSTDAQTAFGTRFRGKPSTRGLGLSLSICKDTLETHGGTLRLEESNLPPGRSGTPGAALVLTLRLHPSADSHADVHV